MDFFRHQDQARKKTWLLILLFMLAVLSIVLVLNIVVFLIFSTGDDFSSQLNYWMENTYWEHPTAAVVLLIFFGSLKRYFTLSDGGRAVANMVGAKLINMDSNLKDEKKYINIVSEMSIASGVPMPELYVMDREPGINAFVAGFRPTEAVMVVTRGALQELSRDELQGVVAHEFSHILNGDMRINIRLMAILAGILTIGQFGKVLMRSAAHGRSSRNSGPLIMVGLVVFVTGYIGLFFGRLIKSAISRQREYLADASSVQFTRNPKGIAGALYKIKENSHVGYLNSNRVEEMSHMCFAGAMKYFFESLLATHPPLDVRINTIDPSFLKLQRAKSITRNKLVAEEKNRSAHGLGRDELVDLIGNPQSEHLAYAALMVKSFSLSLKGLLHTPTGAQAIVYALILAGMKNDTGMKYISEKCDNDLLIVIGEASSCLHDLDKRKRLPLIDLLLPVLKSLDEAGRDIFVVTINELARLDKRITLFEFVILTIVNQHLNKKSQKNNRVKYHSFKHVVNEVRVLISMMAQTSRQTDEKVSLVYNGVMQTFAFGELGMIPVKECDFKMVSSALNKLNYLSPLLKRSLIAACVDCVLDDGVVMPDEAELLRATTESLDCPMPPILQR